MNSSRESMIDTSYDITVQRETRDMVRNWDTVREILLKIEALPSMNSQFTSDEVTGAPPEEAAYLMHMLIDAGLIMGGYRTAIGAPWSYANRLTWQGHDFLDSIRVQTVWEQIKAKAISEARPLSIEAIKVVAKLLLGGD